MPMSPKRLGSQDKPPKKAWRTTTTSSTARGYGRDWQKLRAAYIQEHPMCEQCESNGIVREADEVHHLRAFIGVDDPLRLDWSNLQSVCQRCHQRETGGRTKRK